MKESLKSALNSIEAPQKNRGASSFVDTSGQKAAFYYRFGQRLRQVREMRGLTQEELAQQLPLSRGYLSEIETGKRRVSLLVAHRLAQVLNTTIDSLLEVSGDSHD